MSEQMSKTVMRFEARRVEYRENYQGPHVWLGDGVEPHDCRNIVVFDAGEIGNQEEAEAEFLGVTIVVCKEG